MELKQFGRPAAGNVSQASSKRVIIVDDDHFTREVLRLILRERKYQVVGEATDGKHAMEFVRYHQADYLFLDLKIPGMDGMDVLEKARMINPGLQVIIMSSYATTDIVKSAMEKGAAGFIVKPFNASSVFKVLDRLVSAA